MSYGYSYIRFSTPQQASGDSYRRQMELSEQYAKKHGITLDTSLHLTDLGVSAFKGANASTGRLGAFLQAIESDKVKPGSYLLVENLDRLSRASIMDAFSLFARILNYGITIVTLTDEKVYTKESCNDIGNILMSIIFMVRAHDESLQKSKRLSSAWHNKRTKAAQGQILTKKIPAWLKIVDNKIVVIPERASVVERIFTMSLNGIGHNTIAKMLNESGVASFRNINGWHASYIQKILEAPSVYGEFTPHKKIDGKRIPQETIPDYYPAVITRETHAATARAIVSRQGTGGIEASHINLFTHILKCADCKGSIIRINKGYRSSGPVMVCDNGRRSVSKCGYKPWLYEEIESAILNEIRELNLPDLINNTEQCSTLRSLHKQVQQVETQLTDIGTRISSLLNAIETTSNEIPILTTRLQHLTDEQERVTNRKDLLLNEYKTELNKIPTIHKAQDEIKLLSEQMLTPMNRFKIRSRLKELIDRIDVYLSIRKLVIRYNIGQSDDESKTIVRFKSGSSITL